ncbi:alkane 1-monooxygenase [Rheinheimera maricola]|uniref:Alkane 1-monooxygenase n=1 Tax=Rheinheimera maricola TaxID=2793282 RepID=A0ABS7X7D7_9GAMM|nr:alkane 1-monooxygenase [Rheinheimera maricola]MBZ9611449.1 alkane 1-monooxygenase [Rheinheimera maricola]
MLKYLKFSLFHCLSVPFLLGIILGGHWMVSGLLALTLVIVFGDLLFGDDNSEPDYQHPRVLNVLLYSALPALCLVFFAMMWSLSQHDLFGFGHFIQYVSGYDALAARQTNLFWHYGAMCLAAALLIALLGTVPAHELTHRTGDPVAMLTGRWLLAFSWDTAFAIEHVYGHHRYVATAKDPASAPRGRNVYQHICCSTLGGNISAWRIEAQRLSKKQQPALSTHNRIIRGIAMSLMLSAVALWLAGWQGLLAFSVSALLAKALLEIVNYVEHYGLYRLPNQPVRPYHSWNSNKRISSWASFNLTRHSHHHARATVPFYQLKAVPDAPQLPTGYLGCILLALLPPLWFRLMEPKLARWEQHYGAMRSQ